MSRFSARILTLSLVSTACVCGAFVSPVARSKSANVKSSADHATINSLPLGGRPRSNRLNDAPFSKRRSTFIASKEEDEVEDGVVDNKDAGEAPIEFAITDTSKDVTEKKEPSVGSKLTFNAFKLFSYCLQFAGAFFFLGLILNLLGFGYTVDLERGLVVDRIQNIRNEVQFEREIEREERAEIGGSTESKYIIAPSVPENSVGSVGDQ